MDFTRVTGPTGDPFLDTFHRRHPDVDLVVLPARSNPVTDHGAGPATRGDDAHPIDTFLVADVLARLDELVIDLWAEVRGELSAVPETSLAPGRGLGTVLARSRVTSKGDPAPEVLRALRASLERRGVAVRHEAGEVERLVAVTTDTCIDGFYTSSLHTLQIRVESLSLHVGMDRVLELTEGTP